MKFLKSSYFVGVVLIFISLWIATGLLGTIFIKRYMFEKFVYVPKFHADRTKYKVMDDRGNVADYPWYHLSAWSPFPLVVFGKYDAMWGFTGGHGGRRIFLWLPFKIVEFNEYDRWDS